MFQSGLFFTRKSHAITRYHHIADSKMPTMINDPPANDGGHDEPIESRIILDDNERPAIRNLTGGGAIVRHFRETLFPLGPTVYKKALIASGRVLNTPTRSGDMVHFTLLIYDGNRAEQYHLRCHPAVIENAETLRPPIDPEQPEAPRFGSLSGGDFIVIVGSPYRIGARQPGWDVTYIEKFDGQSEPIPEFKAGLHTWDALSGPNIDEPGKR